MLTENRYEFDYKRPITKKHINSFSFCTIGFQNAGDINRLEEFLACVRELNVQVIGDNLLCLLSGSAHILSKRVSLQLCVIDIQKTSERRFSP
jgi:hypothetical protein